MPKRIWRYSRRTAVTTGADAAAPRSMGGGSSLLIPLVLPRPAWRDEENGSSACLGIIVIPIRCGQEVPTPEAGAFAALGEMRHPEMTAGTRTRKPGSDVQVRRHRRTSEDSPRCFA